MDHPVTVMAVGDLVLDEPDPDSFFAPSTDTLRRADLAIGHVEVPHSTTTTSASTDVPAPPADPEHLKAVTAAGFDVVTLAGNHVYDAGTEGVADTIAHARAAGLLTAGAGMDLEQARTPAVVERGGLRIAVLSYNCVGPKESWATSRKAGCAYVKVLTHYDLEYANPGGPPTVYTFAAPDSLRRMQDDVRAAAASADVVCVSLHKGIGHTPVHVADYERQVSHAAVDAGASVVFGHHAHIMRGIEVYRGRPVYHGLGNFVTVTRALTPSGGNAAELEAWARKRREMFGFAPDPRMPTYPFHPESRATAIAVCRFGADGRVEAGFVPCWIDDDARPVPLGRGVKGEEVAGYVERISREAGLDTRFEWSGDEVLVRAAGEEVPGE
ncbi:CapA family protein [Geodermatophilus nigrescens]|uniref:Poly-gamma-glutamate synthesis protein (Capsule biosynthesis protein) n=1 Tax=Geodermatophilus nigrescens TaxID=1070870 RepID=A0A1M5HIH6_9ACTN|nr:CapA family protein [Geodermatophilus nigrescens]SHG15735.1 poly-gamma-glutamate synthesis protein (capsule biosynthesis protein) [Geodermatophilus nigrescens]